MDKELMIVYEDKELLVCVKPAGIATETRALGQQDMVSLLRNYRNKKGEEPYIGLVHRLDQPVEGLLVFGKTRKSTGQLSRQLTMGNFSKIYLAVTKGALEKSEGRLVDFLKKDSKRNTSYITTSQDTQGKRAELEYQVLEEQKIRAPYGEPGDMVRQLVRIHLLTGRHHQIRVQLAHAGVPLVGERKYSAFLSTDSFLETAGDAAGLALCACELAFEHPVTQRAMKFQIRPSHPAFGFFTQIREPEDLQAGHN